MVNKAISDPAAYSGPYDFKEKDFRENVSLYDYASLGYILGTLPSVVMASVAWNSVKFLWSPHKKGLREAAWESAMMYIAANCNWPQLRRLCPVRPLREELNLAHFRGLPGYNYYFGGENFSARWLVEKPNRRPEDPVLLYMHGGSYALKVQRPQLKYLVKLVKEMKPVEISILIVDYTIGPFAKHPTQLHEGMACYKELRKSCNNIIFFGDSCGGHMALSMLLSGARCEGLVLISPSTDMTTGLKEDLHMREVFVDPHKYSYSDPLISPLLAEPKIWKTVLPEHTICVWGSAEECKEQMKDFAEVANIADRYEEPGGSHDCILRGNSNRGSKFIKTHLKAMLMHTSPTEFETNSSSSTSSSESGSDSNEPGDDQKDRPKKRRKSEVHMDKNITKNIEESQEALAEVAVANLMEKARL